MKTFARFLQLAYVTTDFDRALDEFSRSHGVRNFLEMRNMQTQLTPGRFAELHVGLAWVGDTQIEIIAPLSGADEVYRAGLPSEGFAIHFHHIGQTVDTLEQFHRLLHDTIAEGIAIPIQSSDYFYADLRGKLGHYVEYISNAPESLRPERLAVMESIPRN
jgi:hypothetical protein